MLRMYEYRCKCGKTQEILAHHHERKTNVECPCGGFAFYTVSAPRIDPRLGIHASTFSSLGDAWERKRSEKLREEQSKSYYDADSGVLHS